MKAYFFLIIYYCFAIWLPNSYIPVFGKIFNAIRISCVKNIFKSCGKVTTINRKAFFGNGKNIEIGDYSGIGANCNIPNDIRIGKYVMIGPNVCFLHQNHEYKDINIPMCFQGYKKVQPIIIEDDCWIGQNVLVTAGRKIRYGSIVAAGSVVTRDFEPYSIIGGNPARCIKSRN